MRWILSIYLHMGSGNHTQVTRPSELALFFAELALWFLCNFLCCSDTASSYVSEACLELAM